MKRGMRFFVVLVDGEQTRIRESSEQWDGQIASREWVCFLFVTHTPKFIELSDLLVRQAPNIPFRALGILVTTL